MGCGPLAAAPSGSAAVQGTPPDPITERENDMMRRSRGRGNGHGGNPNAGNGGNQQQQRRSGSVPNRHQVFDSNGPEVRIRGNAWQVCEKYQALARDAQAAGDRVKAENYLQHAEHYYRIILSIQEAMGESMPVRPREEPISEGEGPMPTATEAEVVVPQDLSQMPQPSSDGYEALQPHENAAVA